MDAETAVKGRCVGEVRSRGDSEACTRQRITVDQVQVAGYPLVAVGHRLAKDSFEQSGDIRFVHFPNIGLSLAQPTLPSGHATAPVYDVYFGFMWHLREAGYPEDGLIKFSRFNFLQMLGWVANGRTAAGTRVARPSGKDYKQLAAACVALSNTSFHVHNDKRQRGWNILQDYDLQEDLTGPRPVGVDLPLRSSVTFTRKFVEELMGGSGTVEFPLDLYLSLGPGMSRVFFRALNFYQHEGRNNTTLRELYSRLGSSCTDYRPWYAKKMLEKSWKEMMQRRILTQEPEFYQNDAGEFAMRFEVADPEIALAADEELVQQAIKFGVVESSARELVISHRPRFKQTLAAVVSGRLRASKNIAGLIVTMTRDPKCAIPTTIAPRPPIETVEEEYRSWVQSEHMKRLQRRPDINLEVMRREIIDGCKSDGYDNPEPWMVDGLVEVRLSKLFDIPSLAEFEKRRAEGSLNFA